MTLKLMLQDLHWLKVSLDEQLPLDIMKKWVNWCSELENSKKFSVERWLFKRLVNVTSKELEIFVDASDQAYTAVVYIQSKDSKSNTHRAFVACKARAVPIKQFNLTIPKKELLAAMCGARLGAHVVKILKIEHEPQRFWSDSKTVLSWIGAETLDKLEVFVKNRVSEIRKLTKQSQWSHISGVDNPADMPSRGLSVSKLLESQIWLKGPSTNPTGEAVNVMPVAMPFCMKTGGEVEQGKENVGFPIEGYSSFHKAVRIAAFVNRAVNLLKAGGLERRRRAFKQGPPTVADGTALMQPELLAAKHRLLKDAQRRCFGKGLQQLKDGEQIDDAKLRDFHPFIDSDGLVRFGGRLEFLDDNFDVKYPILLAKDTLTTLLVENAHVRGCLHLRTDAVLNCLRQQYWIIQAEMIVKSVLYKCVKCRRMSAQPAGAVETPLPPTRLQEFKAFSNIGIDYLGPFAVKNGKKKVWGVIFTCCVTSLP